MIKRILISLITVIAVIALLLTFIVIKGIKRENRQEAARLALIPAMLPSAYPPVGGCYEVLDQGAMYLYFENGQRKASRTKPDGLDCKKREVQTKDNAPLSFSSITTAELENIAAEANKELPRMLDDQTRADNVVIGPAKKLTNNITLITVEPGKLTEFDLQKLLVSETRPRLCSSKKFTELRSRGATIAFNYHDNKGNSITELVIGQYDCSESTQFAAKTGATCKAVGSAKKTAPDSTHSKDFRIYRCDHPDGTVVYTNKTPAGFTLSP